MELASEVIFGIGALIAGSVLVWIGKPNKAGENPGFLRVGFMQMIYPATVLAVPPFSASLNFFRPLAEKLRAKPASHASRHLSAYLLQLIRVPTR